ncbi:MAG: hypothetical protein H0T42_27040 [Deltaproteobacteria bacterium]|nr:hypothetical protein [Deltaproteobacteria bacterium]
MRVVLAICLVASAAACDTILGLEDRAAVDAASSSDATDAPVVDLDMDGEADNVDLCIAPSNEGGTNDFDMDNIFDPIDACPLDSVNGVDGVDMDGLGTCDPFPSVPDRSRCLLLFTSAALNSALWLPRLPDESWSNEPTKLIADPPDTGDTLATTIVAQSLERADITTYDAAFDVTQSYLEGSITLWLRADPTGPSADDVGCRYVNVSGTGSLGVVHGSTLLAADGTMTLPPSEISGRIRGRIVTAGAIGSPARITCELFVPGFSAVSNASVPLPLGRMGFTVDRWLVAVRALHIVDQP